MAEAHVKPDPLPPVRGKYTVDAPLGESGWFRAGGKADVVFRPADADDLADFLKNCPTDVPVMPFGVLSNTIIRDGGVRGVVIRLGGAFAKIERDGDLIHAGAAALDMNVADQAATMGLSGLEFFCGIPGTIGGALRMNAGATGGMHADAHGQTTTRDVLVSATAVDRTGVVHTVTAADLTMTHRHCSAPEDWVFTGCTLRGVPADPKEIADKITALKAKRAAAQPIRERTGGSTFANPSPEELAKAGVPEGTRTWQLIDKAGCRGLRVGGAQMSEMHCNFMINTGGATAYNLETLGETVRKKVFENSGVILRWEIRRVGDFAPGQTPPLRLEDTLKTV